MAYNKTSTVTTKLLLLAIGSMMTIGLCAQGSDRVNFSSTQILCATRFSPEVNLKNDYKTGIQYYWDFGDGQTSTAFNPVHRYSSSGNYRVTLRVTTTDIEGNQKLIDEKSKRIRHSENKKLVLEEKVLEFDTPLASDVIDCKWLIYSDLSVPDFKTKQKDLNTFALGTRGIWRESATYTYRTNRDPETGTYGLENFDRRKQNLQSGWVMEKEVTQMSLDGNVLEQRNASRDHTGFLYDKVTGKLIARGTNMRHDEMAYTGFEKGSVHSGNWIFESGDFFRMEEYDVISGEGNYLLVEGSYEQWKDITSIDVRSYDLQNFSTQYQIEIPVLCAHVNPQDENQTVLILDQAPHENLWLGTATIKTSTNIRVDGVVIDDDVSHTGQSSLKVLETTTIEQPLLHLDAGKSYVLSGWVSTQESREKNNFSAHDFSIDVAFLGKDRKKISQETIKASGNVIEGWQKIEGLFVIPSHHHVTLHINAGSDKLWIDDMRLYPNDGNMESFVYEGVHKKEAAVLDNNNYASFYFYDSQGKVFLKKIESRAGVKTLFENIRYTSAR